MFKIDRTLKLEIDWNLRVTAVVVNAIVINATIVTVTVVVVVVVATVDVVIDDAVATPACWKTNRKIAIENVARTVGCVEIWNRTKHNPLGIRRIRFNQANGRGNIQILALETLGAHRRRQPGVLSPNSIQFVEFHQEFVSHFTRNDTHFLINVFFNDVVEKLCGFYFYFN